MGVRSPEDRGEIWRPTPAGAGLGAAIGLACVLLLLLLSNGRHIGAGDTRPTERVAASLVQEGNFDLDEFPEIEEPFAKTVAGRRVSIYPVLPALLAAPVFVMARLFFALDETGSALAGKLAASLFSACAAGLLYLAVARRRSTTEASFAAVVFALGTSVWSTSQALWQHPAAVLFLALAVFFLLLAEEDPRWAGRAGLPLALAVAARHADMALAATLAVGIAARWPRRLPAFLCWAAPAVGFVLLYQWRYFGSPLQHGFSGGLGRFAEPWGVGHLGLLVSPGKGLLIFTPVAAVAAIGLLRAFRTGHRWLAGVLGAGAVAHWMLIGRWVEWHGGESWGPRMMTDVLPLLLVFLPEGIQVCGRVGTALALFSVAVQALGAFAYDSRWERLYQRPPATGHAELWNIAQSPIAFHARERVLIGALPAVHEGKAIIREHPFVVLAAEGSRVSFGEGGPRVRGADPTVTDVHLQRGARIQAESALLRGRWDGVFLRVLPAARTRSLELRVVGRGRGTLYVGERTFWSETPRWTTYPMSGPFRIRHPYRYPESGGPDLLVTLGKATGEASLDLVALISPGEPDNVIMLP